MGSVFVDGEPVLPGGRGQGEWQHAIRTRLDFDASHPALTFVVSALRRRGHPFDLDNLVHPVLMVFDEPIDGVHARLHVGDRPGLLIEDSPFLPPHEVVTSIYVESHSSGSDRGRDGVPDIASDPLLDEHEGIGLSLEFDRADVPIRRGWFGPTEAVVDDLVPWLGTYTTQELIADHRIRDLRFTRGVNPGRSGVQISVWYVPEEAIPVPADLGSRIR